MNGEDDYYDNNAMAMTIVMIMSSKRESNLVNMLREKLEKNER